MRSSYLFGLILWSIPFVFVGSGCRTTRSEVPPPPNFARDGRKLGGGPVGFSSAPKAGFMTDATTQMAPGVQAPGGDRSSVASTDGLRESPTSTIPAGQPPRKGISGLFDGMTSSTESARRDAGVDRAGFDLKTPPAQPLDPPVSLPPPPLIPPPPAVGEPAPAPPNAQSASAPAALPQESALPPMLPEPKP